MMLQAQQGHEALATPKLTGQPIKAVEPEPKSEAKVTA